MKSEEFLQFAKEKIAEYNYMSEIKSEDIFLVWFCKTIQNKKAIFTANVPDGKIFEATYNGEKNEFYIDEYIKTNKQTYKM